MIPKKTVIFQVVFFIFLSLLILYPFFVVSGYRLFYIGKIYPKIYINQIDVSGLTKDQALQALTESISQKNKQVIYLTYQNRQWPISLTDINWQYLSQNSVDKAYNFGREGNLSNQFLALWQLFRSNKIYNLDYYFEKESLDAILASISAQIEIPTIPPTLELSNNQILINPGRTGVTIDIDQLTADLSWQLSRLNFENYEIPLQTANKEISQKQLDNAKQKAQILLTKEVKFVSPDQKWQLAGSDLITFLSFYDNFDQNKIASYTAQLALLIDRPSQDALFTFLAEGNSGRVLEFKAAKDGLGLNQEQTNKLFFEALEGLLSNNNNKAIVNLPIEITKPNVQTSDVNNFGIKELLGTGESYFKGSIHSRIHNIQLAANKINGRLVAPGEIFSFNNAVGEISSQTGFQQAYIIKEGRTVLGDGGGVCQVSTTLFRAALAAGLPIEERQPHAYRVSYYEQKTAVGQDATVFDPSVDFKFKNDTPAYILIQSDFNASQYKLAFHFFGTSDGREVTISKSRVWDQLPPPPDLYQDDPSLLPGTIKQVDWKAWGAKVAFDWKVTRGNEVLQQRTFFSNYRPWQAIFLKGPG